MNSIQNYGMINYQTNFQARNAKKTIKTLASTKNIAKSVNPFHEISQPAGILWADGFLTNREFLTNEGEIIPIKSIIEAGPGIASCSKILDGKILLNVRVNGDTKNIILEGIPQSKIPTFINNKGETVFTLFDTFGGPYKRQEHQMAKYLNLAK